MSTPLSTKCTVQPVSLTPDVRTSSCACAPGNLGNKLKTAEDLMVTKHKIPFIDDDYDTRNWFDQTKGQEWEPERGKRCSICFDMRFLKTAQYAELHGFSLISSTLGISRWKDMDQINESGTKAAMQFKNIEYWTYNWRKDNGSENMLLVSKSENFYMQEYCGCVYSLRDTNIWRSKNNRPDVQIGLKYYSFSDKNTSDSKKKDHA